MTLFEKTRRLLTPTERKAALSMLFLMLIGMVFEMLGIGLVIPAVSLMVQPEAWGKYPLLGSLIGEQAPFSHAGLVALTMAGLVIVYLAKNLYSGFLIWKQASFTLNVQASLCTRLFALYLRQPYTFHLQRNSAQLVRNVTSEVANFSSVISSLLLLLTELCVLAGLAGLLLWIEPWGAISIAAVLGSAAWGFHMVTRNRISRWGGQRQYHDGFKIQHLQQGLGGAKDVKLLGRERDFLDRFEFHNTKSARIWKLQTTLQALPRLMFEMLGVLGLAILVITMLRQGRDSTSLLPVLGLFAASAFRFMPSINRILGAIQNIQYNLSAVDLLYEESQLQQPASQSCTRGLQKTELCDELKIIGLGYAYPATTKMILQDISLTIKRGALVGIIGPSGSGKSTLIDLVLGLLTPLEGTITADGIDIHGHLRDWQNQIGYVPQSIYLTDDTLRRNVAFGLADEEINEAAVRRAIVAAQLTEFVDEVADGLDAFVGERGVKLSGGQRQRIGIARALYHNPSVLVFDEATSALDIATEDSVMSVIMSLKGSKTMILVAHRLATVQRCDAIFRLEKGRVVASGSPAEVLGHKIQHGNYSRRTQ
jgi:ABC-type multidrug transport system fused ATPase/permease subunit